MSTGSVGDPEAISKDTWEFIDPETHIPIDKELHDMKQKNRELELDLEREALVKAGQGLESNSEELGEAGELTEDTEKTTEKGDLLFESDDAEPETNSKDEVSEMMEDSDKAMTEVLTVSDKPFDPLEGLGDEKQEKEEGLFDEFNKIPSEPLIGKDMFEPNKFTFTPGLKSNKTAMSKGRGKKGWFEEFPEHGLAARGIKPKTIRKMRRGN